jgi:hypothetical protein
LRHSRSGENFLQLAGADHRVHFRNVLADLIAETLDQATGNHQPLRLAARLCLVAGLVARHLEDGVDGFPLRAADKRASIHHDDVGVGRVGRESSAGLRQHAHHHLAIDEVFGAAEADKSHLGQRNRPGIRGHVLLCGQWNYDDNNNDRQEADLDNSSIPYRRPYASRARQ